MIGDRPERVGVEAFRGRQLNRPGRVAVAFLADWCPFCRVFEPEFARLPSTGGPAVLVADVSSLDNPLWDRFEVEIVPTVVLFDDGQPVLRADGVAGSGLGPSDLEAVRRAGQAGSPRRSTKRSARRGSDG